MQDAIKRKLTGSLSAAAVLRLHTHTVLQSSQTNQTQLKGIFSVCRMILLGSQEPFVKSKGSKHDNRK